MLRAVVRRPSGITASLHRAVTVPQSRLKRHEAFGAHLDQDAVADARKWHQQFDESQLPKGQTTYARSSGPGGQHVNKTETKALTVYPCSELFAILPKHLHPSIRSSKYYTANSDAWTFQAQTQRSRTANADDNRRKLTEEVMRIYHELTPNETSSDKKEKHRKIEERFHDTRIKQKKMIGAKKQSRRGPSE